PDPAYTTSSPAPAAIVSSPPRPHSTSFPAVPTRLSGPQVPTMVHGRPRTVVSACAALFDVLGSVVASEAVAESCRAPGRTGATRIVTVADAPAEIVPSSQWTVPEAGTHVPWDACDDPSLACEGSVSSTATPEASAGPPSATV